jgi:uncharacterized protein YbjQ (UPF0145 family)
MLSGLSGNELYCLSKIGWRPGNVVVGNSVWSLGLVRGITSGLQTLAGGEIKSVTDIVSEGRHMALARLRKEAINDNAGGVTGVTSELGSLGGYIEFLAIGSSIRRDEPDGRFFSTACSGQDLYCQVDSGYEPMQFVIGNVAYALGVGRGLMGMLRTFAGGEVREFSEMYNHTRHLALERLEKEAQDAGANSVVDINTSIHNFGPGVREMLMVGTASHNPVLGKVDRPVTSELTGEELWNLTNMGYAPLRLLLGTSIYGLGLASGIGALFRGLVRGELDTVTRVIYEARENCMDHLKREADQIGADAVIGTKLYIYELGAGLVEVMAIGTAVKKVAGIQTRSENLFAQAVTRDRDTFFDRTFGHESRTLERT